jgi:repressor LexA
MEDDMEDAALTKKQEAVLSFITKYILDKGFSPTVREIVHHFGLASPNSAKKYLTILEQKEFIRRKHNCSRSIEVRSMRYSKPVPIVGRVRAGIPHQAIEDITGHLVIDRSIARWDNVFLLRVEGDSMIEAHIQEGDMVLVKPQPTAENGEIVVTLIEDEATLKRFFREQGHIRLQPANHRMKPIIIDNEELPITVVGKVVAVLREMNQK